MFFLPSRNRPERLQQALDKISSAGTTSPGVVVIDGEEPTKYAGLRLPEGWRVEFLPKDMGGVARVWNWCVDTYPDLPWYGMITDDLHVQTKGWDKILIETAGDKGIASANDLWQSSENIVQARMHGAAVFGGELIRTVGYWAPRGMIHNCVDDLWENIGRSFGSWTVRMDVITEHLHPGNGKAMIDETYAPNMNLIDGRLNFETKRLEADRKTWKRWNECERSLVWDALVKLYGRAPSQQVSIQGATVAVCVPAHDNSVTTQFLQSWTETLLACFQAGTAVPNLITLPGESMIMRARNTLVWSFLHNTQCEYLLFVDSDMGWAGAAVPRLLALAKTGKMIVGAAGPRKQEPITFCTRLCGPYVQYDRDTGCVRATELGTGFVLIHRSVFETMMKAFPELEYDDDGRKVFALFDTSIIGRKLFSEDYTFMHRAQKCGFEVWVDPTIELQHVGTKVFRGALGSELTRASERVNADVVKVA
ncbi:MAG: hypothetical protein RL219_948 [Actinomycetota bacterium]